MEYEMVLVDDGSKDSTLARAIQIAQNDPRVKVVKFRRNCGQTAAMAAGIEYAAGEVLVTMDGDLQNDPLDIPMFLQTIDSGYDIVVGWRFQRQDKLITRQIPLNSEMHRFIPAMASIAAPRIAEVKARHHARRFGKSKYGLSRIYKVLLDMLVIKTLASFASSPLLWFGILAIPLLLAGTSLLSYVLLHTLLVGAPISLPIAGCGVIFLTSAFMMVCSGALGELVYNLGDMRDHEIARLTQKLRMRAAHVETQAQ